MDFDLNSLRRNLQEINGKEYCDLVEINSNILKEFYSFIDDIFKCHFIESKRKIFIYSKVIVITINKVEYKIEFYGDVIKVCPYGLGIPDIKEISYKDACVIPLIIAHEDVKNCKHCVIR